MTSMPGDRRPRPSDADLRASVQKDMDRVEQPARLMRVSSMARALLQEAKQIHLDLGARERLLGMYERAVAEIAQSVAPELRDELDRLRPAPGDGPPTEMEIRVLQSQLVGWLEGVFQGIQVGLQLQQAAARQQQLGLRYEVVPPSERPKPPSGGPYL
ncbi:proteasome activator [Nonomuraea pusilla]|uniref:proteasome activator n=1 Tax=Nonomuraea pusilla TaxID=46177 RepID=UPI003332D06D